MVSLHSEGGTPQNFNLAEYLENVAATASEHNLLQELSTIDGPPAVVLASAGYDHTIRLWDVVEATCLGTLQHNESQVNCMALTRDKQFLGLGGNPAIRIFDVVAATKAAASSTSVPASTASVNKPLLSSAVVGGMGAGPSTSVENAATLATANLLPSYICEGHQGNVVALGFSPLGPWMWSGGEDGTIRIWSITDNGFNCQKIINVGSILSSVDLHPRDPLLFTADHTGIIHIYNLTAENGRELVGSCTISSCISPDEEGYRISCLSVSPSGIFLAAIDVKGRLFLWQIQKNKPTVAPSDGSGVTFNLAKPSSEFTVQLKLIYQIKAHSTYGLKCRFSPDSACIVTTSADGTAKLWKIDGLADVYSSGNASPLLSTSDSPLVQPALNHSELPTASAAADKEDPGAEESQSTSGPHIALSLQHHFRGHLKWVWDCTFSADSAYLVTASSDCTLRLWDVATGETVAVYAGHSKAVTSLVLNDFPS